MGIVLGMIGGAVVLTLIGCGLDTMMKKMSKNETKQNEVNKQEEN